MPYMDPRKPPIVVAHEAITVATATTPALTSNDDRLYALLINDSDTTIYLNFGDSAVAHTGIRLNANGGSFEMSIELGNLWTGSVNAIHSGTGTKILLVTEGI